MNVMKLLEFLYEELSNSSSVPLTGKRLVDVEKCLDIVSELRVTLPDDVKDAEMIVRDRDRILKEAELQAKDIQRDAEAQFERMVSESNIVTEAQRRAQDIVNSARRQANEAKLAADDYADDLLAGLEKYLKSVLDDVRDNRDELKREEVEEGPPRGRRRSPAKAQSR